jgi:hypothetical protein
MSQKNMFQLVEFRRFFFDQMIPSDQQALEQRNRDINCDNPFNCGALTRACLLILRPRVKIPRLARRGSRRRTSNRIFKFSRCH